MLHPRNVIKLGTKTFSCWRNSTTIFGRQFLQIQNWNECQSDFNIPFIYQQLSQRYQFSKGNEGGIHLLPFEKANSAETLTNNVVEQTEQQQSSVGREKRNDNQQNLEMRWLGLDMQNERRLKLEMRKGRSGQKYFDISFKNHAGHFNNFRNIPVPEDAYAFVRALDELIEELAAENFEQKLEIQDPQSTNKIENDGRETTQPLKLKTVELIGLFHNFQLGLVLYLNTDKGKIHKRICLALETMHKANMRKRRLTLPLQTLPWLRKQMAEMLAKYDGTKSIEEAPAQIPKQFFQMKIESN